MNTIEKEIARLHQLGKKPVPYVSTSETETVMTLYLSNKHKIIHQEQEVIRAEYLAYGRLTDRQKVLKPTPIAYAHELNIYYDKKGNLMRSNREKYYAIFYWILKDTIYANPGKKVYCTFNIAMYIEDELDCGHTELILYDPALNVLEHVDSNNLPKQSARGDRGYFICCEMCNSIMSEIASIMDEKPIYVNNTDIYSGYEWGIQSLEASSDKLTEQEKEGYCLVWAILFGDLALTFPEYSVKQIVQIMMKKASSKRNAETSTNDYLLSVVRGYVATVSRDIGVTFDDVQSKTEGAVRLANEGNKLFTKIIKKEQI
jgi:hypothetical protein